MERGEDASFLIDRQLNFENWDCLIMTKVVGIDLGTTNPCIAIIEGGQYAGAALYLKCYLKCR